MNILIIEPSRLYRIRLEKIFEPYATHLYLTESSHEARIIYEKVPVDLICLSFYLQDMDGVDFISEIRKQQWGETIPVLMITSKNDQEIGAKVIRSGVTEVFSKEHLGEVEKHLRVFAEQARQQANISGDVLLIDSDMEQAQSILEYFANTQLRFVHFASAEQAADIVRAAEFDMVITNAILIGAMTSMTLIREIREINDTMYRVPVLAICEVGNVWQKLALLRAGANDLVQKPILLEELSLRVKNMIQAKQLFDTVELQYQQLEDLAIRDQLTGLYNRNYLLKTIDTMLQDALQGNYPVSLLVLDLDLFKKINDTHGHNCGDQVLKSLADLLLKNLRGSDTSVRYGGEEFLVLLPACGWKDAQARADLLRQQVMELNPVDIPVTVSIGVSQTRIGKPCSFQELFAHADKALYEAKAAGRNCVRVARIAEDDKAEPTEVQP